MFGEHLPPQEAQTPASSGMMCATSRKDWFASMVSGKAIGLVALSCDRRMLCPGICPFSRSQCYQTRKGLKSHQLRVGLLQLSWDIQNTAGL